MRQRFTAASSCTIDLLARFVSTFHDNLEAALSESVVEYTPSIHDRCLAERQRFLWASKKLLDEGLVAERNERMFVGDVRKEYLRWKCNVLFVLGLFKSTP
jgi:hypothetical protein